MPDQVSWRTGWGWGVAGGLASVLAVVAGWTTLGTALVCLFSHPEFWFMIPVWAVVAGLAAIVARWCFGRVAAAQLRVTMTVVVWRQSVHPGDDFDGRHEWIIDLPRSAPLSVLIDRVRAEKYLAQIAGGRATWVLMGRRPLAVVAQEWVGPRHLVSSSMPLASAARGNGPPHFEFRYEGQVDPAALGDQLQAGRPLTNRFGPLTA